MLDADNVPVKDPAFLFDSPQYREHGAIFWPDYNRLAASRRIWDVCEVPYRDEPEFESGQLVVDKSRCWEALNLTMHLNEHSDFYYKHIHGDKETFHLGFLRAKKTFAMPAKEIHPLRGTMCQHDFEGKRLFQHRNMEKWTLAGRNRRIDGFFAEDECLRALEELRRLWNGRVLWNDTLTRFEKHLLGECCGTTYQYVRVGHDSRPLELKADRTIGQGAAARERMWTVSAYGGGLSLIVFGDDDPTCRLTPQDGIWQGRWYRNERMPIRLEPTAAALS